MERRTVPRGVIGMIHLPPLPGSPGWGGSMGALLEAATADARALQAAGVDAVLVENFGDAPFYADRVPPETVAAMTRAVAAAGECVSVPVGVNVLRNDAAAALAVAAATGAAFIRVNVHVGGMYTDQGWIQGRAADTLRSRERLAPRVAVLADVLVKHATPPAGTELAAVARDAWHRGLADALIVSGAATGGATDPARLRAIREAVPAATIVVGSGVTEDTIASSLSLADAVIVGTALQDSGPGGRVSEERARGMVRAADGAGRRRRGQRPGRPEAR